MWAVTNSLARRTGLSNVKPLRKSAKLFSLVVPSQMNAAVQSAAESPVSKTASALNGLSWPSLSHSLTFQVWRVAGATGGPAYGTDEETEERIFPLSQRPLPSAVTTIWYAVCTSPRSGSFIVQENAGGATSTACGSRMPLVSSPVGAAGSAAKEARARRPARTIFFM